MVNAHYVGLCSSTLAFEGPYLCGLREAFAAQKFILSETY